jgi:hypothetical protein
MPASWQLVNTFNFAYRPIMAQMNSDGMSFAVSLSNEAGGTFKPYIETYTKSGDPTIATYSRDQRDLNLYIEYPNPPGNGPWAEEIALRANVMTATITYGAGLSTPIYASYIFKLQARSDINAPGAVIAPLLSASGVKSFKIPHPLKSDTVLIHSCIEGPRCDLMYRGHVKLSGGTANVNIDTDSSAYPMTEGTFVALSTNARYFLQNNDSFDRVRGQINGNILAIVSENLESTDEISWMVISERKDQSIIDCERTDWKGLLIPEHSK